MKLYDARRDERDSCGIGFIADAAGRSSRAVVDAALEALRNMSHRGAVAADSLTGDGAGLLLPIPRRIIGPDLPAGAGADHFGIAMLFVDPADADNAHRVVEEACRAEGIEVAAWRPVPVDPEALGDRARASAPQIEQALLLHPSDDDHAAAENRCFRARKRIEQVGTSAYVASMSFTTVTYKALCAADQLARFYPDLADGRLEAWFALFHQRYSTNTTPTWERAQPFRFLGHNGEINTISGNVALMRAREGSLGPAELAPEDLLVPAVDEHNSDSGILDEALELLAHAGRDVRHAAAMLVPAAWEGAATTSDEVRSFYHYHACLIEPWDGPAGMVFTDGLSVNAALDRNGLRPLRVAICEDGWVACASEAGAVPTSGHGRVRRARLGPGQMLSVDPRRGGLIEDDALKLQFGAARPYAAWMAEHLRDCSTGVAVTEGRRDHSARQVAAGYTKEEVTVILRPMATAGAEPTSSMGDDTPEPPFARYPRMVFSFLKQRFAQVTNPPIDHLRERHVMSIATRLGARAPLLEEHPHAAGLREYESFLLYPSAVVDLEQEGGVVLDASFDVADGPDGLEAACRRLARSAAEAVSSGAQYVIVSDRAAGRDRAAVPSALGAGAVHHHLVAASLRSRASLIVECDDAREAHHVACLLTNGADAVCPRLALESICELATTRRLGGEIVSDVGQRRYVTALEDGVLKIMSKMGISTLDSYRCAQIIEAVGLGADVVELCFAGLRSPIGGLSLLELGADIVNRHQDAWGRRPVLVNTGVIKFRRGGEQHAFNPDVVDALHASVGLTDDAEVAAAHELRRAVRGDPAAYERFAALANQHAPSSPRDLLDIKASGIPVEIEEVEPAVEIARRFSTAAMSHGALSAEAHETLAIALNMIGGAANSGEGGEAPERYREARNCSIKQVASGRFGATPDYLAHARELQIKMAQGSKPGEGGQLPGKKVSVEIAQLRHTVPGIALISPPPHHDIYSIEDLAQLIFDLKQANPKAAVSVKLVATQGIGTIAAGVVKGLADVVHISGADGGTGASPLSSIKNAGIPWEIGLAETQSALIANGLRARARLRVDGGLKTGRDIVVAALLGADEFSFGTAALIAEGCILVRTCHRNTCPVGIATQDEKLRAKFAGTPEMVVNYLMLVAEEVRTILASIGLRSISEATGRTDLLVQRITGEARADSCDLSVLLGAAEGDARSHDGSVSGRVLPASLGDRLYEDSIEEMSAGGRTTLEYEIGTSDRSVGARLGCGVGRRFGARRPPGQVQATFRGSAGQSFGAWLSDGVEMLLIGEANDYVCKSMAGGRVAIRPPEDDAGDPCLAGNTVLYGATGGQLYIAGRAGERFAVRNSGAVAVVEGTGDHACEYMTAGAVVILGSTGVNLGAGMSGGEAYVFDPHGDLEARLNPQLVAAYAPTRAQLESLRRIVSRHLHLTGSDGARRLLDGWQLSGRAFRRVAPVAEVARLESLFEGTAA